MNPVTPAARRQTSQAATLALHAWPPVPALGNRQGAMPHPSASRGAHAHGLRSPRILVKCHQNPPLKPTVRRRPPPARGLGEQPQTGPGQPLWNRPVRLLRATREARRASPSMSASGSSRQPHARRLSGPLMGAVSGSASAPHQAAVGQGQPGRRRTLQAGAPYRGRRLGTHRPPLQQLRVSPTPHGRPSKTQTAYSWRGTPALFSLMMPTGNRAPRIRPPHAQGRPSPKNNSRDSALRVGCRLSPIRH